MNAELQRFVAAAPPPQRAGLRVLLTLATRPRGRSLLHRLGPLEQAANGVLNMERLDRPGAAPELGWDAAAVVARGRALRRAEGRP